MNEKKTSKKKKVLLIIVVIVALIIIFMFRYRDYIFNMISIKKHSLDTADELNDRYTEHKIDENGKINPSLDIIEFQEIRFNHVYGELEEMGMHSKTSFNKQNKDGLIIVVTTDYTEGVDLAEYYEIPDRIKNYMRDAYGEELLLDEYMLLKKAYEITPDDLSFFGKSRDKLVSNTVLLIIKAVDMPNIFDYKRSFFESKTINGFQDGLAGENSSVFLRIFDATGKADRSYIIIFTGNTTQEEIDVILNSMEFNVEK